MCRGIKPEVDLDFKESPCVLVKNELNTETEKQKIDKRMQQEATAKSTRVDDKSREQIPQFLPSNHEIYFEVRLCHTKVISIRGCRSFPLIHFH